MRLGAILALAVAVTAGCAARRPAPVVFLSDFGTTDDSVAICKGVMLGIAPDLRIVDLTHDVGAFSIVDGARLLAGTAPYWPRETVFLAVVDPGVGGERRPLVVATRRGQVFVVPDNGLVTLVAERDGVAAAREIANPAWVAATRSATFHGRDVFAPVAARIARGDGWRDVGPPVADVVRIDVPRARMDAGGATGTVVALDGPYGNLVTDVPGDALADLGYALGDAVSLDVGGRALRLPLARTFGDVPAGEGLVYVDSRGRVALALNRASFAKRWAIVPPAALRIQRKP